ncbi:MAG: pectate lyase, partial [Myxococcota bacterium]|nr:pectate lyase [Myxococcota bacterium]
TTDDASGAATPNDGSLADGADGAGWGIAAEGGAVVAFPGALGFGQVATGGRGGTVYHVTSLNDTGPGSFRDAVSAPQRIVVFDVGGYINLSTPVSLKSHLTIAGQTAPGDGIGIMAGEASFSGATDIVVRYVRFRQGTLDPDSHKSGINLVGASRVVLDHVSVEFAQWNNIDSVGATDVTVQYSIDANPIGQQFAAHTETGPYTWFGNLFANAHNRNPLAKANTQFVDNVVYDFQAGYTAGNTAGHFTHDVVGNYFITGPATTSAGNAFFQINTQAMFFSGNFLDGNADGVLNGTMMSTPGAAAPLATAWSPATALLPSLPASAAYAAVIATAGASLHRDAVDTLVVSDVTSLGKLGHLWTTQVQTGLANSGYGTLAGGTPPLDTDQDGMPDAWEKRYGLNPNFAGDANGDFDHTGYTNIEKYINGLVDKSYPTQ